MTAPGSPRRLEQVHLGLKFPWFIRPDDPPDLFEPAHLWFLYFLLVYSLLLLPVLLYLRGNGRQLPDVQAYCTGKAPAPCPTYTRSWYRRYPG
jgi:hypothetical protein